MGYNFADKWVRIAMNLQVLQRKSQPCAGTNRPKSQARSPKGMIPPRNRCSKAAYDEVGRIRARNRSMAVDLGLLGLGFWFARS